MDESNRELPLLRDSICARLGKCERKFRGTRNSELCGRQCFDRKGGARLEVNWNDGAETGPIVDDGKREGRSSADPRRIFASRRQQYGDDDLAGPYGHGGSNRE